MADFVYFPESVMALNAELINHPELCEIISKVPPQDFDIRIGHIAAYCGVLLDGLFTENDLDKLCDMLTKKLKEKHVELVLPPSSGDMIVH